MTQERVPSAVWEGSFKLFGVEIKCYTLDDGRRIIEAESLGKLLTAMSLDSRDRQAKEQEAARFAEWLADR